MFCSICLMSGNTKPLVAKWKCCFKDILLIIYIYIYILQKVISVSTFIRWSKILIQLAKRWNNYFVTGTLQNLVDLLCFDVGQIIPFIESQLLIHLHAEFFSRSINMYFQLLSFLHTDITEVVRIIAQGRQGPTYFSISWVLITWQGARSSATMILTKLKGINRSRTLRVTMAYQTRLFSR